MRAILTILLLTAAAASVGILIWQNYTPDATRSLQLCERIRTLEFDQKTTRWKELVKPIKSVVVCSIPGTTQDIKIEGLIQPFTDTPLAGKMVKVDCYRSARMKSGALATQMPDGLYCNIPVVIK
jgi:hypothetical protein